MAVRLRHLNIRNLRRVIFLFSREISKQLKVSSFVGYRIRYILTFVHLFSTRWYGDRQSSTLEDRKSDLLTNWRTKSESHIFVSFPSGTDHIFAMCSTVSRFDHTLDFISPSTYQLPICTYPQFSSFTEKKGLGRKDWMGELPR